MIDSSFSRIEKLSIEDIGRSKRCNFLDRDIVI
jgi:hypothetical protein